MFDFFSLSQAEKDRVVTKFQSQIDKNGPNGCWLWMGSMYVTGYGRVRFNSYNAMTAHKFSWMIEYKSAIPGDLCCLHSCDIRRCVNPKHIFLGTRKHNMADCLLKDRKNKKKLAERFRIVEDVINGLSRIAAAKKHNIGTTTLHSYLNSKEIIAKYGKLNFQHRSPIKTLREASLNRRP